MAILRVEIAAIGGLMPPERKSTPQVKDSGIVGRDLTGSYWTKPCNTPNPALGTKRTSLVTKVVHASGGKQTIFPSAKTPALAQWRHGLSIRLV